MRGRDLDCLNHWLASLSPPHDPHQWIIRVFAFIIHLYFWPLNPFHIFGVFCLFVWSLMWQRQRRAWGGQTGITRVTTFHHKWCQSPLELAWLVKILASEHCVTRAPLLLLSSLVALSLNVCWRVSQWVLLTEKGISVTWPDLHSFFNI